MTSIGDSRANTQWEDYENDKLEREYSKIEIACPDCWQNVRIYRTEGNHECPECFMSFDLQEYDGRWTAHQDDEANF